MSDLHSINEAINKKAGRKLFPSILVGLLLLAIVFSTMSYAPIAFAAFVTVAVLIALKELTAAFKARGITSNYLGLGLSTALILGSTWIGRFIRNTKIVRFYKSIRLIRMIGLAACCLIDRQS